MKTPDIKLACELRTISYAEIEARILASLCDNCKAAMRANLQLEPCGCVTFDSWDREIEI